MRFLTPYILQVIAAAIILIAVFVLTARLPPVSINVTIQARDITVSGDY